MSEQTTERMPAAFFGHGNPMNALELNRYSAAWREFGRAVPRPRAILVVSAHCHIGATAVTARPRPRAIHDFYGFAQELFDVRYPAPGLPELALPFRRDEPAAGAPALPRDVPADSANS